MLRIMGKLKSGKKYKGFDYEEGFLVTAKIHHTLWPNLEEANVQRYVDYMNEQNQDYEFKLDRIKEK